MKLSLLLYCLFFQATYLYTSAKIPIIKTIIQLSQEHVHLGDTVPANWVLNYNPNNKFINRERVGVRITFQERVVIGVVEQVATPRNEKIPDNMLTIAIGNNVTVKKPIGEIGKLTLEPKTLLLSCVKTVAGLVRRNHFTLSLLQQQIPNELMEMVRAASSQ